MKKLMSLTMAIILSLGLLAGCGSNKTVVTPDADSTAPTTAEALEFTRGTVVDGVYSSDFSGIVFEVPKDWTVSTDEELAQAMGLGSEYLTDETAKAAELAKLTTIYDLMCSAPNGIDSISIVYENVVLEGTPNATEEEMADAISNTLISGVSLGYAEVGVESRTLGSHEYVVLIMSSQQYGFTQTYYLRRVGDYCISIIITSQNDDLDVELADCFK